jgi:hypothetical protein
MNYKDSKDALIDGVTFKSFPESKLSTGNQIENYNFNRKIL